MEVSSCFLVFLLFSFCFLLSFLFVSLCFLLFSPDEVRFPRSAKNHDRSVGEQGLGRELGGPHEVGTEYSDISTFLQSGTYALRQTTKSIPKTPQTSTEAPQERLR